MAEKKHKPTPAQLLALELAAIESIQYFQGGYYTITSEYRRESDHTPRYVTLRTLRACIAHGWIILLYARKVYGRRWKITPAGLEVLDETRRAGVMSTPKKMPPAAVPPPRVPGTERYFNVTPEGRIEHIPPDGMPIMDRPPISGFYWIRWDDAYTIIEYEESSGNVYSMSPDSIPHRIEDFAGVEFEGPISYPSRAFRIASRPAGD